MVMVTTDQEGIITLDEGEKSFIVFNFTYSGTRDTNFAFTIYTNKEPYSDGVPIQSFTAGSSLQYVTGPSIDSGENLISVFHVLLVYGALELDQSRVQCHYTNHSGRSSPSPCNISIFITVKTKGK